MRALRRMKSQNKHPNLGYDLSATSLTVSWAQQGVAAASRARFNPGAIYGYAERTLSLASRDRGKLTH
jgi:hypothetical protein